ncbi:MAG: excisionase family DNA-binding protein [Paracoccaceae bacterium]|nr:excisionase family DNA-binding protein [Paracoccaceae bacterium]
MVERLFSPRETASRTGWPERRIRLLIAQNQIRHLRIGAKILVPATAIDEFVNENMIVPEGRHDVGQKERSGE